MSHWSLILIAACANVLLNLCLQKGGRELSTAGLRELVTSIFWSPWMWVAMLSAVLLLSAFVAAVRIHSLSLTYTAVTALAMVTLTAIGMGLQQEPFSIWRIGGLGLIISGLIVTALAT